MFIPFENLMRNFLCKITLQSYYFAEFYADYEASPFLMERKNDSVA